MYLDPDLIDDESAVAEGILAGIADRVPGFRPAEGHQSTPLAEATGIAIATAVRELKATVLDAYIGFGLRMLRLPRGAAGVATAVSTWTFDSDEELLIDAGTEVTASRPDGQLVTFVVLEDLEVPPGTDVVHNVQLAAIDAGPESNGAVGETEDVGLVGVVSVSIDAPAAGGADPEDAEEYVDRASDRARRMNAIPITPADYAAFALDLPIVGRAFAVNRFDPDDPLEDSLGHITLFPLDPAGALLTAPGKLELAAYFASFENPLSSVLHIADLAFVDVAPEATIKVAPDADPAAASAAAATAITDRLDPAVFDADDRQPGGWAAVRSEEVTVYDVTAAIDDLPGLEKVTDVEVNGGERVALPGPVSLPRLSAPPVITVA